MSYHIFDETTSQINKIFHDVLDKTEINYELERLMGLRASQFVGIFIERNVYDAINMELKDDL
jgi:hypothetical protein